MSDNKDNIDLDKEIESLENLLNDNDGALDDGFPLDDDLLDEELAATPRQTKSKSGVGKYVAYVALLAVLGGGGYAAYKFLPSMLQNDALMALQNNMATRTTPQEPQQLVPMTSDIASVTPETVVPVVENIDEINDLPVAADEAEVVEEDIVVIDDFAPENDPFDEAVVAEVVEEDAQEPQQAAETIAEALATVQEESVDPMDSIERSAEQEVMDSSQTAEIVVEDMAIEEVVVEEASLSQSFERVPARPLVSAEERDSIESSPVVEEDMADVSADPVVEQVKIEAEEVAVDIIEQPVEMVDVQDVTPSVIEEVVVEQVEESSPVMEEKIEEPVLDVVETIENVQSPVSEEVVVEIKEEMQIPSAPVIEAEEVEVKTAEPVKTVVAKKKTEPKEIVVNNKPLPKVDARVESARRAMAQGHLQEAANLYQAVLNDNPSSTAALTGLQLTKARMRLNGEVAQPVKEVTTPSVQTFSPSAPAPVVVQIDETRSALDAMNANPRDASLAVKVAEMYKAQGNNAKAVEFYKKALQLDIVYKSGLDRMAVYDALAGL